MATYTNAYFPSVKQHKFNKDISVIEKLVDLSVYPARFLPDGSRAYETGIPYANNDVIEVLGVRAGTTVLGIEVEVISASGVSNSLVAVGDGSDTNRFGEINLESTGIVNPGFKDNSRVFQPYTYASADTIDVKLLSGVHGNKTEIGVNLITTPGMGADTGWTIDGTHWDIALGALTRTANAASLTAVSDTLMQAGRYYYAVFSYTLTAGACTISGTTESFGGTAVNTGLERMLRVTTDTYFTITANATAAGDWDNVYLYLTKQNTARFLVRAYVLEDFKRNYKR